MFAEFPELLIPPLKTNVGYARLFRPIQFRPQITESYTKVIEVWSVDKR
jgi:hypothetical protein